jgi:hypothetical protein
MDYYVLSLKNVNNVASNGITVEMSASIADVCGAVVIEPGGAANQGVTIRGKATNRVLLVVVLTANLIKIVEYIPEWRKNFGTIAAYIIDPWFPYEKDAIKEIDCYFLPDHRIAEKFYSDNKIHTYPIPLGVDVMSFGCNRVDRPLDLVAYGRQASAYLDVFKEAFNDPKSNRFLFHDTLSGSKCLNFRDNRRIIWKLLHKSRCALAFDFLATPGKRPGDHNFSIIPMRYYEAVAAGTVIVGKHPVVPEMATEFDWPDATIDLPNSPMEALGFLESLLDDRERLATIHRRNYIEAWRRHDIRYRIRDMLQHLGLPLPEKLQSDLETLKQGPTSSGDSL